MLARRILVRVASLAGVLLILTLAVFFIQRQLPSDPARVLAGRTASPEALAAAREQLGLDQPFLTEYLDFLGRLLHGDLGMSIHTRNPVRSDIGTFLPATVELVLVASVMAIVGGLALGVLAARGGWIAAVVRVVTVAGASAATFLVGVLLLLVFYRNLGWLPAGGRTSGTTADGPTQLVLVDTLLHGDPGGWVDGLKHLLLPASVLAFAPAVAIGRVLRGALRTTMKADFMRSASAKGGTWLSVVRRHGMRNSLGPVLSMTGLQIGMMLGSSVIVELIFSWPGVGNYLAQSIKSSDFAAITGVVLVLGVAYVFINFVVDTLQVIVDPRQRSSS